MNTTIKTGQDYAYDAAKYSGVANKLQASIAEKDQPTSGAALTATLIEKCIEAEDVNTSTRFEYCKASTNSLGGAILKFLCTSRTDLNESIFNLFEPILNPTDSEKPLQQDAVDRGMDRSTQKHSIKFNALGETDAKNLPKRNTHNAAEIANKRKEKTRAQIPDDRPMSMVATHISRQTFDEFVKRGTVKEDSPSAKLDTSAFEYVNKQKNHKDVAAFFYVLSHDYNRAVALLNSGMEDTNFNFSIFQAFYNRKLSKMDIEDFAQIADWCRPNIRNAKHISSEAIEFIKAQEIDNKWDIVRDALAFNYSAAVEAINNMPLADAPKQSFESLKRLGNDKYSST
jgi:hypothetical protein